MLACRICGLSPAKIISSKYLSLCPTCDDATPPKLNQVDFDVAYWPNAEQVPHYVRRDFYSDYVYSSHGMDDYILATAVIRAGTMVNIRGFEGELTGRSAVLLEELRPDASHVPILLNGKRVNARRWEIAFQVASA